MAEKPRSQRLQVVLDMAIRDEDAVRVRLQETLAEVARQEARRDELMQYQADYLQQASSQHQSGARALQNLHNYIAQLADVLRAQEQRIAHARLLSERVRNEWRQAHEKRRGMERFIDECRRQEQRAADKIEQKMLDELAGRRRPGPR